MTCRRTLADWWLGDPERLDPAAVAAIQDPENLLPPIHGDPFDRMLIAQTLQEGLLLATRDKLIARYPVPILRAQGRGRRPPRRSLARGFPSLALPAGGNCMK
ncbi:MAG: hypothetical protein LBM92_00335 [Opitutaceae bacterium]|jgi:PIN domain nuclease of toxin-antitoxin system|nr:hypothetical protein [Opitutaceae bacterium]